MDQKTKDELREASRQYAQQYMQQWLLNPNEDTISVHLAEFVCGLLTDASFEFEGEQADVLPLDGR